MKIVKRSCFITALFSLFCACQVNHEPASTVLDPAFIPQPVKVTMSAGSFAVKKATVIYCKSEGLVSIGKYLGEQLGGLEVKNGSGKGINLIIAGDEEKALGKEGYKLNVTPGSIEIIANKPNGIFYGVQTLLQMLPPLMAGFSTQDYSLCAIRCAKIEDFPRFQWRGLLLDVSRHFFTIDEVKKLIDQMAVYKFNILQLHLTDDQDGELR